MNEQCRGGTFNAGMQTELLSPHACGDIPWAPRLTNMKDLSRECPWTGWTPGFESRDPEPGFEDSISNISQTEAAPDEDDMLAMVEESGKEEPTIIPNQSFMQWRLTRPAKLQQTRRCQDGECNDAGCIEVNLAHCKTGGVADGSVALIRWYHGGCKTSVGRMVLTTHGPPQQPNVDFEAPLRVGRKKIGSRCSLDGTDENSSLLVGNVFD